MKDSKYFNCSQSHEVEYMASKFKQDKEEVMKAIKDLCAKKVVHYSTHQEVEKELIKLGFTKK